MEAVTIIDVAPRDGLQNEPETIEVAARVELIERLLAAGVPRIEIGSFVDPRQVPQMAGTDAIARTLTLRGHNLAARAADDAFRFTALAPNERGYERAVAAGLRHVRLVLAASDGLNRANFKRTTAASLAEFSQLALRSYQEGIAFGVAIGAAFGCPFDGYVSPERVLAIAEYAADLGANEIILADTTGMAVPTQVATLCRLALQRLEPVTITVHFHNTRNTGYANAFAAWQVGIRSFDAALGGIGGCPFAPRAVGNVASEDLVHMFNGIGAPTGIDLPALLDASNWLSTILGRPLPALVGKAGPVYTQVATTIRRLS
ncbi:MAG: hydroxymethylglutaryl-CoA lyase [Roseiflexus sp.]|nr:hydroxymethylglutaryl-CoA lyase [Roseiflexus sp.]MCS7289607.1 hydroxymethylglutaryl-CoA lyase [Roseiflexus sp.]MDW8233207.1 hydroxymethylglutaryl-CoA lyase [Roseiflexaceae bacterium]